MNPFSDESRELNKNNNKSDKTTTDPFSNETTIDPFSNETTTDPFSNETTIDPFSNETTIDPFSNETSDPFSNEPTKMTDLLKEDNDIELWVVDRGRKCDTYISYLPYTEAELLAHLKNLKKKLGCGGSIQNSKDFETEEISTNYFRLHIQGNQKNYIKDYFTKLGIKNIKVKG
jgi:translation initiation factor 1 (eIF-1/SUI1)